MSAPAQPPDEPTRPIDAAQSLEGEAVLSSEPSDTATGSSAGTFRDRRGQRIGRYVVVDRIGAGGMGEIVLAYDPQLDRRVAIKLLRDPEHAPRIEDSRLLLEAQALAKLTHPNVVGVHDAGVHGGRVYVAMEHVEGVTLGEWLKTPRPWRQIVATFVAAGRGLAAAHEVGIIHRDFKPGNVMVDREVGSSTTPGRVRVLDFGLARRSTGPDSDELPPSITSLTGVDDDLTRTGFVHGTPGYMSPEQFARRSLTPAADQFAFCVALYAALYGERPFAGESYEDLERAVTTGKLKPPGDGGRAPAKLRAIVVRGLVVDPIDRWPSMSVLLGELERVARPIATGPLLGVGALAVAIGGLAWSYASRPSPCAGASDRVAVAWDATRREQVERGFAATDKKFAADAFIGTASAFDRWAEGWVLAYEDACSATHVRGDQSAELLDLRMTCLDDRLTQARALADLFVTADVDVVAHAVDAVRRLPAVEPCNDRESLMLGVRPPADAAVAAAVADLRERQASMRALELSGKERDALGPIEEMLDEARALGYAPLTAELLVHQGRLLERLGRFDPATDAYHEASVFAAEVGHAVVHGQALASLGGALGYYSNDTVAGLRALRLAEAIFTHAHETESLPQVSSTRGIVLMRAGRFDEALVELEAARAGLGDSPGHAYLRKVILTNLSALHGTRGDPEMAARVSEEAAARIAIDLGEHHPNYGTAVMNLGAAELKLGRYDAALEHLARARAVWMAAFGPKYPDIARAMTNEAAVLAAMGQRDRAIVLTREVIELKSSLPQPDGTSIAYSYNNLCDLLMNAGEYKEAIEHCKTALQKLETAAGPEHPTLVTILYNLGTCEVELGRFDLAIDHLDRAERLRGSNKFSGEEIAVGQFSLARALLASGKDPKRARTIAEAALTQVPDPTNAAHVRIRDWLVRAGKGARTETHDQR